MISLLLASRGRPWQLNRMIDSAISHASSDIEIVVIVDDDDSYPEDSRVKMFSVPRTTLSKYWNIAYEKARGPIYMLCNDDVVFQTEGWDRIVERAFESYPDGIVLVHGSDGEEKEHGALPFIHRNWVEAVGYFVPPYFSSDFADTWLNEVAVALGRRVKVDILTEHMHPAFGKGEQDLTYAERLVRHWKDDNIGIYESKADERLENIEKLKRVMA